MRIVIALGGNALGDDPLQQVENVKKCIANLLPLFEAGHEIIITHGNGPQVGLINLAFSEGRKINQKVYSMPFPECGAMSEGYIGYHIQNALKNKFLEKGLNKEVVSLVTQVEVDKNDPSFKNPTKPIGSFYTLDEIKSQGYPFIEDSGRGYRRVVASPKPVAIVEKDAIMHLLKDAVVIACGGGGIPVIKEDGAYTGVDAVIDKDFASSKLASDIGADLLLILTQVNYAKINFGLANEENLKEVGLKKLESLKEEGHFKKGSMLPKIEASIDFVKGDKNRLAIITSIEDAFLSVSGKAGTRIYNDYD